MADVVETGVTGSNNTVSLEGLHRLLGSQAKELERLRKDHNALRTIVDTLHAQSEVLRECLRRRGVLTPREFSRALEAVGAAPSGSPKVQVPATSSSGPQSCAAISESLKENLAGSQTGVGAAVTRAPLKFESEVYSLASARSRASSEPTGRKDGTGRCDLYAPAQYLLQASTGPKARARALQTVEFALTRGASPHSWHGPGTPLRGAVQGRCPDLVALLLQARASPDEHDEKGVSALHLAAFDGHAEICKVLLEYRANTNYADCHGQTPLFFAPSRPVCEALFKHHADMNATNHKGQSALHLAGRAGLGDVLMWLSSRVSRALLTLRDEKGAVAADYARQAGVRLEVLEKLEQVAGDSQPSSYRPPPSRSASHLPVPGADPAWESLSPLVLGVSSSGPEVRALVCGPGGYGTEGPSPRTQLHGSAALAQASDIAGGRRAASSSADYRLTSVAGGMSSNVDERKSFKDEMQLQQARLAAKHDQAMARKVTAKDL